MSRATAKICGLSTRETLEAAVEGQASHVGLMFFPPSPRNLSLDTAAALASAVPARTMKVGVFVDPDDALLDATIAAGKLDMLQLHRTNPARTAHIRQRGLPIWTAIAVKTRDDLQRARTYRDIADRILYDAKTPEGAALPGGMGVRFDWSLLGGFRHPLPWALSGGLDAENVGEAIRQTGATLVDASSGLETAPGVKDVDKIAAFLKAVDRS